MRNNLPVGGDHYIDMGIDPWDIIDGWPIEQQVGFHRGNALKYIMRMGAKGDPLQDAKKAAHYIEKMVEVMEVTPDERMDSPGLYPAKGAA